MYQVTEKVELPQPFAKKIFNAVVWGNEKGFNPTNEELLDEIQEDTTSMEEKLEALELIEEKIELETSKDLLAEDLPQ